jgi:hypothetical protein
MSREQDSQDFQELFAKHRSVHESDVSCFACLIHAILESLIEDFMPNAEFVFAHNLNIPGVLAFGLAANGEVAPIYTEGLINDAIHTQHMGVTPDLFGKN